MIEVERDYEAEAKAWEAHGWPTNGIANEWCGDCDVEFEDTRVDGTPYRHFWDCPKCGITIECLSDDEVAVQTAHAWASDAGTSCPPACGDCAEEEAA